MAVILCLAHYCDTHGPTPLMVTEGLQVSCDQCPDYKRQEDRRQSTSSYDAGYAESMRRKNSILSTKDSSHRVHTPNSQPTFSSSAIETPPESPRISTTQLAGLNPHRRDSSFRKTYDENDRQRAVPCENCALTLPAQVKQQIPEGAPGSPVKNGLGDNGSPVLRTRKPFEKISNSPEGYLQTKSTPSDSDDSEGESGNSGAGHPEAANNKPFDENLGSSEDSQVHAHFLDYTSTHDPLSPASFSLLRQSCLRTLSCETLPPSNSTTAATSPGMIPISSQTFSAPTSTSGGPIFFGDPAAGYTTAYIFRIPDPHARGRRRVYALMALSTQHERTAMHIFPFFAHAFRDLASWIQALADQEAERQEADSTDSETTTSGVSPGSTIDMTKRADDHYGGYNGAFGAENRQRATAAAEKKLLFTPTSAFLTGRTLDPDGFPRKGVGSLLRSRGLAELVGRPEFFIELHAHFVALLAQLSIAMPTQ